MAPSIDSPLTRRLQVAKSKSLLLIDVLASLGSGSVVDVTDAGQRLALDVAGACLLGYDFGAVEAMGEVMLLR